MCLPFEQLTLTLFLTDLVTWYTMRGLIPPSPGRNKVNSLLTAMSLDLIYFSWWFCKVNDLLRCSTSVLVFVCWPFNTWFISSWEKLTVLTSWTIDKMTTIFTQNGNFTNFEWNVCHFVNLLRLQQHLFHSQIEISHVLNGPTVKNQHRCRAPKSSQERNCSKSITGSSCEKYQIYGLSRGKKCSRHVSQWVWNKVFIKP